ncbi:MAG: hypothetical protein JKY46_08760 [Robiginitomaculum sp.]|nr:hypothetical protein [Robiginitomaculum sp.]
MLKITSLAIVMVLAGVSSGLASEACLAPSVPELPSNGAVITYEQLNHSASMVAVFSKENTAYKTCLDHIITAPGDHSRSRWREALESYNQSIPTENAIWAAYEKLSRDWVEANQANK